MISLKWLRSILLGLALVSLFLSVLALAFSVLEDQHGWDPGNTNTSCLKCHQDIQDEIDAMPNGYPHETMECLDCHSSDNAGYYLYSFVDVDAHAAVGKPECQSCHKYNNAKTVMYNGAAGTSEMDLSSESHRPLYQGALSESAMIGANEACVVCHTAMDKELEFTRPDTYGFYVDFGNSEVEPGALDSAPDKLSAFGRADLKNLDNVDLIRFRDTASDNEWSPGDDIFNDANTDGDYDVGEKILYVGDDGLQLVAADAGDILGTGGTELEIAYIDADHDGTYDTGANSEEALIYVGDGNAIVGDKLMTSYEVLDPYDSSVGDYWNTATFTFPLYYWFIEDSGGIPGTYNNGDAIFYDYYDDNILGPGRLDGTGASGDRILIAGKPDVSDFANSDNTYYRDANGDGTWDFDEDIFYDSDGDGAFDWGTSTDDQLIYVGDDDKDSGNPSVYYLTSSNIRYLDTDHDGEYDVSRTQAETLVYSEDAYYLDVEDIVLDRTDNLLDLTGDGTYVFGVWNTDMQRFYNELWFDGDDNGEFYFGYGTEYYGYSGSYYGEAILRETYRLFDVSTDGSQVNDFNYVISSGAQGLHYFNGGSGVTCGSSTAGCHQEIYYAINDNFGGGHHTDNADHAESATCRSCHTGSDEFASTEYHASKSISCAYEGGCHSSFYGENMKDIFEQIQDEPKGRQGDICWGCHRGSMDWSDPASDFYSMVDTEDILYYQDVELPKGTIVYDPTSYTNCRQCHDDSGTYYDVPTIPVRSGKYIDHDLSAATTYWPAFCSNCHQGDDTTIPHGKIHTIDDGGWDSSYYSFISNSFCSDQCHYSIRDSRPEYYDHTDYRMSREYDNFYINSEKHGYSAVLGGSGVQGSISVDCTTCHSESHYYKPSCYYTESGPVCHTTSDTGDLRKVSSTHISGASLDADRTQCWKSGCHSGGAHDPDAAGGCHGCTGDTGSHAKHIGNSYGTEPQYAYACSECHWAGEYYSDVNYQNAPTHNNAVVNVAFGSDSNTIASALGVISSMYYTSADGTCGYNYCHSDGYDYGSFYGYYQSPNWASGEIRCGDCHGVPNYYPDWDSESGYYARTNYYPGGKYYKELWTESHLKHQRNFGGIQDYYTGQWYQYYSRYLAYLDDEGDPNFDITNDNMPYGWQNSIWTPGEAIIRDNGNYYLDWGLLDGLGSSTGYYSGGFYHSPDMVYYEGTADLNTFGTWDTSYHTNPYIYWFDADSDSDWDPGEDIWRDEGGDTGTTGTYDDGSEYLLYVGYDGLDVTDQDTGDRMDQQTTDRVMFLDSDHDGVYDGAYWETSRIPDRYLGTAEPLVFVGNSGISDTVLRSTHEILEPYPGGGGQRWIKNWFSDENRWYSFDCSECHYNAPPTNGLGTYGTSKHVDADYYMRFDPTSDGLASHFAEYADTTYYLKYFSSDKTCSGVYCHSNGYFYGGTNGAKDLSQIRFNSPAGSTSTTYYPDWDNPNVSCGSTTESSCHYAADKAWGNSANYPDTGGHRKGAHYSDAGQAGWHGDNDGVPCMGCHWNYVDDDDEFWKPYGKSTHDDGYVLVDYEYYVLGPQTGKKGAEKLIVTGVYGCHKADPSKGKTMIGEWRVKAGGYSTGGC